MTKEQITEFLNRLEGPEGCNFHRTDPSDVNTTKWTCFGGNDKRFARKILNSMNIGKKEIEEFLQHCDELGGHCDCEILFNAAERLEEDE